MNKLSKVVLCNILAIFLIAGLAACGEPAAGNKTNKPAENKAAENKPAENKPAENKPEGNKTASTSGEKIGVPECDEYIEKYEACVFNKVPEAARGAFKTSFEQARAAWKTAASNPQTKAALGSTCKSALDTAKTSLAAYQCDW